MSFLVRRESEIIRDRALWRAWAQAIGGLVPPGRVVLDVCSGTGVLAVLAARAGARRVYACDDRHLASVVSRTAADNGCGEIVTPIDGGPGAHGLPERADLALIHAFGEMGLDEGIVRQAATVRERWLSQGGVISPRRVGVWCAPVEHAGLFAMTECWRRPVAACDCQPMHEHAVNTPYTHDFAAGELLAPPRRPIDVDLMRPFEDACASGACACTVARAGELHGLALWFDADLSPAVRVTNAPGAAGRIGRRHCFLPLGAAVSVRPDDQVIAEITYDIGGEAITWTARVTRDGRPIAASSHASIRGAFAPASRDLPAVSKRQRAYRLALELADGTRTVADIERAVETAFAAAFAETDEIWDLVADVVLRHTTPYARG